MTVEEIRCRVQDRIRIRQERKMFRASRHNAIKPRVTCRREDVAKAMSVVRDLVPGTKPDELHRLKADWPDYFARIRESAEKNDEAITAGSWEMLGYDFDLTEDIEWHKDPRSNYRWERQFYADLPLYDLPPGVDVKYVWELGRHQFLVELGRAWLVNGNDAAASRTRVLILDWLDKNPMYEGVHWTSGLEVAMRAISWLWTLSCLADWPGWEDGELARILNSLGDHATYLKHHLSLYSSPYNHLIGEAVGLYLIGCTLPDVDGAEDWRSRGREILIEHAPKQFFKDGFCVEQATGYHFYTLGFLTLAVIAARNADEPIGELEPVVHQAYRAGAAFRQPDGRWPAIGDVDSARSIPVHHPEFWQFDSLCAVGAVLFNNSELKVSDTSGQELFWLFGHSGLSAWKKLDLRAEDRSTLLPDSGYAIARHGSSWLLADAGPLAGGLHPDSTPSTAHGHADALQVLYFCEGAPLLVDPGMPFYFGDRSWVEHFRGAAAHNTLQIEGAPMARVAGPLAWSHVADRPKLDAEVSEDVWMVRMEVRWGDSQVRRSVIGGPDRGLWVIDRIETTEPRRLWWNWQLPADTLIDCSFEAEGVSCARGKEAVVAVHAESEQPDLKLEHAHGKSPAAWRATGYGSWQPAQRLRYEFLVDGVQSYVAYIGRGPIPAEVTIQNGDVILKPIEELTS